jgi:hypothetical protein
MNDKIKAILERINEEPAQEAAKAIVKEAVIPVIEEKMALPAVAKAPIVKEVAQEKASEKKTKTVKKGLITEGVEEDTNKDGFLANLVNEAFSYEKRKYAFIEPRLFELFMQVKIKKDIKNISVIVNTILSEYVDKHQEELKKILENKF